jgi:hypothetical protein
MDSANFYLINQKTEDTLVLTVENIYYTIDNIRRNPVNGYISNLTLKDFVYLETIDIFNKPFCCEIKSINGAFIKIHIYKIKNVDARTDSFSFYFKGNITELKGL